MCAGGVIYITNAYIALRLLRHHGCLLPVEIWFQDESEVDERSVALFKNLGAVFRSARENAISRDLPPPVGWALKPFAILYSDFDELLYLDSDNFVVMDPSYLFDCPEYIDKGAVFWPDLRRSSPYSAVWEMLDLYPRDEWEFESGQILLRKNDFLEALRFTLEMNYEASIYYKHLWGDKDTFRFAFHKFRHSFAMPNTKVELLTAAGGPKNGGVMCQHDFEGRRVFQHRNILKWQLFGPNPSVAGFFHEPLCRKFLDELRSQWDGRIHGLPQSASPIQKMVLRSVLGRDWLIAGAGKLRNMRITTTDNVFGMRNRSFSLPHDRSNSSKVVKGGTEAIEEDIRHQGDEIWFTQNGHVKGLETLGIWYWDVVKGVRGDFLRLHGDKNIEVIMRPRLDLRSSCWEGALGERDTYRPVQMCPVSELFPVRRPAPKFKRRKSGNPSRLLLTNTTPGIGDHIHSLYAAVGATKLFNEVLFISRNAGWLARACHPGLSIEEAMPIDADQFERVDLGLRNDLSHKHSDSKLKWYAGLVHPDCIASRPDFINTFSHESVVEFSRYVIFSPFAAHATRDWAHSHWIRLTHILENEGYQVVVLGTRDQEKQIVETFGKSNAAWLIDLDPSTICNLLLEAEFAIGLDSGISHLCGLLGVRAYVIHAQLPSAFLFECAPSIVSIFAEGECRGCRFRPDRGYTNSCHESCSELVGISAARVAKAVFEDLRRIGEDENGACNGHCTSTLRAPLSEAASQKELLALTMRTTVRSSK